MESEDGPSARGAVTGARVGLGLMLLALLVWGWRELWFLTDDAYIAFRYVSNLDRGWGLTWNPPPFLPVEGYTSFLFVVLLAGIWKVTGVAPDVAANGVGLVAGAITLWVAGRYLLERTRQLGLGPHRVTLVTALALATTVLNPTFLTWLSSGLETAVFNLWLTLWFLGTLRARRGLTGSSLARLSFWATLLALTRPEGVLAVAATLALGSGRATGWLAGGDGQKGGRRVGSSILGLLPLSLVPAHWLWRFATYGDWLPNTYYAKHVAAWPESGARYLASFLVEHGAWFVLGLAGLLGFHGLRRLLAGATDRVGWVRANAGPIVGVGFLLFHAGYYGFVVGGDHFEYRILSHLVLLLAVLLPELLLVTSAPFRWVLRSQVLLLVVSLPIPWGQHLATADREGRAETRGLHVDLAPLAPAPLRPVLRPYDDWQRWLVDHGVCVRRREHDQLLVWLRREVPDREVGRRLTWESDRAVMAEKIVGYRSWAFPEVAVIDLLGLNDRVIARSPAPPGRERYMAHDREADRDYVLCFQPNLRLVPGDVLISPRPLSDERIRRCEEEFSPP